MKISPWMVSAPAVAVATLSTGFARVVTVELLLMRVLFGSRGGTIVTSVDTNKQCYEKPRRPATCYTPPEPSVCRAIADIRGNRRSSTTDADPGGYAKWVRCPHGPATVSGYASLGPRTRKIWSLDPPLSFSLGKACEADSCRESGNLTTGGVHSSARETP